MSRTTCCLMSALLLSGCASPWLRECPTRPLVVEVPVSVRHPVPADLFEPVDAGMCAREAATVGEIRRQRAEACAALVRCNAQLESIRDAQD